MAETTYEKQDGGDNAQPVTARARYEQLKAEREPFLTRARECAKVTIPALMPPEGSDGSTNLPTPFQSVGARGVNNLAAKLLLALFPPGSAFFRLDIPSRVFDEAKVPEDVRSEYTQALSKYEAEVRSRMEQRGTRTQLNQGLRHLIVAGNYMLHVLKDGSLKGHRLDRFVVKRDLEGTPVEIITLESLSRSTAPIEVREIIDREQNERQDTHGKDRVDVYTWIKRDPSGRYWKIHQEVCGTLIPGTEGTQPIDKCSWIPLRWSYIEGEDYGRGFCEEHLGDINTVDRLNRGILDFAAAASKVLPMVKPGGTTQRRKVAQAANLEVIEGDAKEVTFLQMEKFADFQVVKATLDDATKRLEQAFLLLSGSQRNAERVTAEEIRQIANELESALGGTYSVLAQELQRPLVVRELHQLQQSREIPMLPDKTVIPQIVTGIAGLGRTADLQRLDAFLAGIQEIFGQDAVSEAVSVTEYAKRRAAALSIDTAGLLYTEEQIQAARQAAAQQAIVEKGTPKAMEIAANAAQPQNEGATQ